MACAPVGDNDSFNSVIWFTNVNAGIEQEFKPYGIIGVRG